MLLGTTRQEKRKDWDCCEISLRPAGSQIGRQRGAPMARAKRISLLVVITLLTIAVHGYHSGTDDGVIYAAGIKKAADPSLYPFGSAFFMHHAQLSLFPAVTWLTRLPSEWSMLFWFAFTQFLLLYAAYGLTRECFRSERARLGGVGLLAAVLGVPVAGTALLIADSYLTARSLSTPRAR
jgi:4-amino-4-deoxy-L-arabinose transferase-like glycosyltransferase